MLVVKFSCHNQRLRRINLCMIPSNAYNNVKLQFDFRTDDWDAVETKFVNLYYNGTNHEVALDKNNQCYLQEDIIYSPKISVSVFGGDIITNTIAIPIDENIKVDINANIYDSLIDLMKNHTHEEYIKDDEIDFIMPKPASVTMYADQWTQTEDGGWYQIVTVDNAVITSNSKVDLQPSPEQLYIFHNKDLAFTTGNEAGTVKIYSIGDKPTNDYTIQATITEVALDE